MHPTYFFYDIVRFSFSSSSVFLRCLFIRLIHLGNCSYFFPSNGRKFGAGSARDVCWGNRLCSRNIPHPMEVHALMPLAVGAIVPSDSFCDATAVQLVRPSPGAARSSQGVPGFLR